MGIIYHGHKYKNKPIFHRLYLAFQLNEELLFYWQMYVPCLRSCCFWFQIGSSFGKGLFFSHPPHDHSHKLLHGDHESSRASFIYYVRVKNQ